MTAGADILPVVRAAQLEELCNERRWLIDTLWARAGVGIIGGAPKCCKSWLGLGMALSVASATPCLGAFSVIVPGGVLIYMAEDSASVVKARLAGLCRHRDLDLGTLPIDVITAPCVRLDLERDQLRLAETVRQLAPRMLLLDPFVRLHRIDENHAGDVSAILAYLRALQRAHDVAVVVVHHARKNGPAGVQAGQGLRGSGDVTRRDDETTPCLPPRCTGLPIRISRPQRGTTSRHERGTVHAKGCPAPG
jgi:RecA-family ATPase